MPALPLLLAFAFGQTQTMYDQTLDCTIAATASAEALAEREPALAEQMRWLATSGRKLVRAHAGLKGITPDQATASVDAGAQRYRNAFAKVDDPEKYRNAALNLSKKAVATCKQVTDGWANYKGQ